MLQNIDATNLHKIFNGRNFDTIIFQFPHSGSQKILNGINPNYALVHDFIISALCILRPAGVILITTVDSDFYNNMFKFEELAHTLGINKPGKYKFFPQDYPEYKHTMTNENESAIEDYENFITWEFRL